MPTTDRMARRIKPAAATPIFDASESRQSAAGRPAGGYSEAEVTQAFEVIRHQASVLRVRSRVAAAALGVPPEQMVPEPVRLRAVEGDARPVDLEVEAAAVRDAQIALDRRAEDLAAREAATAMRERELAQLAARLDADAARLEDEREELVGRQRDVEKRAAGVGDERQQMELLNLEIAHTRSALDESARELERRMSDLEHDRVELEALRRELAAERHELAGLHKDATSRLASIEARERRLRPANDGEARRVKAREVDLEAQLASLERDRQALKAAERTAQERSLAREKELATAEAALVQREAAVEREAKHLHDIREQLAGDRSAVGALQERVNEALVAIAAREDKLRAFEREYQANLRRLETRSADVERQLVSIDEQRAASVGAEAAAQALLAERQEEIAAAEAALSARAARIDRDTGELERARLELADERAALAELRRGLDERTAVLETHEREHKEAVEQIRKQETDLANADEAARARQAKRDDELTRRDAEIAERAATADSRVQELHALEARQREDHERLRLDAEAVARRAEVVGTAERALQTALAQLDEQRRTGSKEHQLHLEELARERAAVDDDLRNLRQMREAQAEAEVELARRYEQTDAELERREAEVERTSTELAAERRRLEDEKRLVAELRVSLDHDARANQAVKEELDRHAAELASQARALAERATSATARQPETSQRADAVSHEEGRLRSRFTVDELATLMERRAAEFPDRVEEWRYYLVSLRNVATSDGRLPESVEYLVEDVFAPLLDAT